MGPKRSKLCDICDQNIKPRGWTTHRKACETRADKRRRDQVFVDAIRKDKDHATVTEPVANAFPAHARDDIKVEHHPSSGIKTTVHPFETFKCRPAPSLVPPPDRRPWYPFQSRLEFEVAEIALEAALNNEQTDRLIKICQRCATGKEKFTFLNHKDIHNKWEAASHRITKFTKEVISIPYDGKLWDFYVHYRDLWELATDLLGDCSLFPHFTFDAQHLSKFDGETFVRFVDEPFTAQDFWDIQSRLPPGGKPLAFILYADKTKLSSFGTAKGYPVVARIANLPTDIRNGRGIGSGYVIGWLPIVKEDKDYAGKSSWVNFKNTVWHSSFARIISSLASKSQTGQWYNCLDSIQRWFFLCIIILSADYEEQCVMSLIRGIMSLWPCPVCLVPRDELWDTSKSYPHRTSDESQAIVATARGKDTMEEKDEVLKEYGLRDVDNSLWAVQYTDVHRALSHDRMHNGGLWSHHLWVELQKYVVGLGRSKVSAVDKMFEQFPRWRNLKHPNQVMSVSFADSSMHEDISKLILYATHGILTEHDSPFGYLLLRCVRLYLEIDTYAAFEVHTTSTINAGRSAVQAFTALMKQYITETDEMNDKGWSFPKMHMIMHIFDDIEAKGTTRNYNTKPNEQMHGPLKKSYQCRTNFKNFAEQILRIDHWLLVSEDIRCRVEDSDEFLRSTSQAAGNADVDVDDPETDNLVPLDGSMHVKIGSTQASLTLEQIEMAHQGADVAFIGFRVKLNAFLNVFLPACNLPLPNGKRVQLRPSNTVTEFRFLQVNYKSLVDWRQHTDYLRCSPVFFNAPRFDCVFIRTEQKVILGRLIFLFECPVGEDVFPLALIHPFDAPTGVRLRKDNQLNFFRVQARPRAQAEFFSVRSIIRGAFLVPDGNLDCLVVDTVDTDMFLHVKEMHLEAGHPVRI
ncbi:hypothetical protein EV702DRAFT_977341 [Suillus placidus]|uniref:Uncharacterized protein n=1 Tax=Suillus placidus TaxID=48579 RepID=A0A9P7CZE9_9AGAM|nr:hypothetical protein EV702DRAFT_977341 [Suillus placidus]